MSWQKRGGGSPLHSDQQCETLVVQKTYRKQITNCERPRMRPRTAAGDRYGKGLFCLFCSLCSCTLIPTHPGGLKVTRFRGGFIIPDPSPFTGPWCIRRVPDQVCLCAPCRGVMLCAWGPLWLFSHFAAGLEYPFALFAMAACPGCRCDLPRNHVPILQTRSFAF